MAPLREIPFVKGHGTGNDFIIVPDLDGRIELTAEDVRYLCDRHRGIGANGLLRVVRTEHVPELAEFAPVAEYCMDYRNADGTLAEMCGNGARVFARYLHAVGLMEDGDLVFATRGGLRSAVLGDDGTVTIDMGAAVAKPGSPATVQVDGRSWEAVGVLAPNPHAVVFVDDLDEAGALSSAPTLEPAEAFPEGANVEFVQVLAPGRLAMRVHERGVGETLSCGTGACAAAWAMLRRRPGADPTTTIEVPGGVLTVAETASGHLLLGGDAHLVARGTALLP